MTTTTRRLSTAGVLAAAWLCQQASALEEGLGELPTTPGEARASAPYQTAKDDLGVYQEDLSRYHVPVGHDDGHSGRSSETGATVPSGAVTGLDPVSLRALFHRADYNRTDGLGAYVDDPSWRPAAVRVDVADALTGSQR